MKYAWPKPFAIVDADGEYTPEFEAYFAEELARLEADVDDPERGEDAREMLAMDREELRALSAVTLDLMNAPPPLMTAVLGIVLAVLSAVGVALIAWYVL
ncbi:hypothetical protein QLQ12_46530 [Actinoplanes sp. NEAU-A12]|uniref:Uncharacterized protein n=1 Tax=Actinoplanes sandaracinus TaxID=3045177 RepID=A0ABT6X213_9ACTN|nr:hypothetical protein [Actinoplanes sandaracinus]MDI6106043.1 hypothetical protein [Actinoplanes sandaracinus]